MFPTAHSQVYYNEAGEPIGWDTPSDDPDFCNLCGATGHYEAECPFDPNADEYEDVDE
jgi:hypothetical protein